MSNRDGNRSANSVRVTNPEDIGQAAASGISRDLSGIQNEIERLRRDVSDLEDKLDKIDELDRSIQDLERRIVKVETEKARARKEAKKDVYERLETKAEEKREKYQKKLREVLGDYKKRIDRLKDRFLNSIAHRSESFKQVEDEFSDASRRKTEPSKAVSEVREAAREGHERRLKSVVGARSGFIESINGFLDDRRQTADLIDSIQTEVGGIDGAQRLQIPFWVVGIERDGREEIKVYPMQGVRGPDRSPTDEKPYADYLSEHPDHSYGDMADAVKRYAQRDEVRDSLAEGEPEFADPSVLRSRGAANERFVDSLKKHELSDREGYGSGGVGGV